VPAPAALQRVHVRRYLANRNEMRVSGSDSYALLFLLKWCKYELFGEVIKRGRWNAAPDIDEPNSGAYSIVGTDITGPNSSFLAFLVFNTRTSIYSRGPSMSGPACSGDPIKRVGVDRCSLRPNSITSILLKTCIKTGFRAGFWSGFEQVYDLPGLSL